MDGDLGFVERTGLKALGWRLRRMKNVKRWWPVLGSAVLVVELLAMLLGESAVAALVGRVGGLVGLSRDAELAAQLAVVGQAIAGVGLGLARKVRAMYQSAAKRPSNIGGWLPLLSVAVLFGTHLATVLGYVEVANALSVLAQLAKLQADPETAAAVTALFGVATGAGVGVYRKIMAQVADAKRCPIHTAGERRCLLPTGHPSLCLFERREA